MPHFFINSKEVNNRKISISDKENYQHIAKSLRIKKGERLLLIDENQIQYETVVEDVTNKEVLVNVENSYKSNRNLNFGLYLAESPLRSDAQSIIIEKATELGAEGVYPVIT
ncbi:MAG: RsmE family RNA methyltransferase, partial [Candidatus Gastranaerophilaceae bacterium]